MRKRARLSEDKCELFLDIELLKVGDNAEDRISVLPDEIIVLILSHLRLKSAVTSSILSKRWHYLWTYVTELDFDDNERLGRVSADTKVRGSERSKYINWVNRVTRQSKNPTLDGLKICFDLDKSSKLAIDSWIKFAMMKRVQNLEIDLLENGETLRQQTTTNYSFPCKVLTERKRSCSKRSSASIPSLPFCRHSGLKYLRTLTLRCVNVNEDAVNCFLLNCPLLKRLSIQGSGEPVKVNITSLSLALEFLELVFCLGLESINLCETKLTSFAYLGPPVDLNIENVPLLDDISIGVGCSGLENNLFFQLSHCLQQVQVLTLDIHRPDLERIKCFLFPQLSNLRQLMLKVGAWGDDCLLEVVSWIHACPQLKRFVLQLIWTSPAKKRRKIRQAAKHPHSTLYWVEIIGYFGRVTDAELVMYFFENAITLQKMIVDPCNQIIERGPTKLTTLKKEEAARSHAKKHLEPAKPEGVKLVIL